MEYDVGTLKFYAEQPRLQMGFVIPDVAREDGVTEIFYRLSGRCYIVESDFDDGVLRLGAPHDSSDKRLPFKGAKVLYSADQGKRGLQVWEWAFKDEWDDATAVINARPEVSDLRMCVVDSDISRGMKKHILWEGWKSELDQLIADGKVPQFENINVMVEERRAHGWFPARLPSYFNYFQTRQKIAVAA